MTSFRLAACSSPIGSLALAVGPKGLVRLDLEGDRDRVVQQLERRFGQMCVEDDPDPDGVVTALRLYFAGDRDALDRLAVDPGGTPFQQSVWMTLRQIPWGQTWSYGRLAAAVGHLWAARAVGAANGANPLPIVLPCHRVIGGDGRLVGYGGGLPRKEWLLRHEGARIAVDSQASLFPPAKLTRTARRPTLGRS